MEICIEVIGLDCLASAYSCKAVTNMQFHPNVVLDYITDMHLDMLHISDPSVLHRFISDRLLVDMLPSARIRSNKDYSMTGIMTCVEIIHCLSLSFDIKHWPELLSCVESNDNAIKSTC